MSYPLHSNAVVLTWSFYTGSILLERQPELQGPQGHSTYLPSATITRSAYLPSGQHHRFAALCCWGTSKEQRLRQRDSLSVRPVDSSFRLAVNVRASGNSYAGFREMATEGTAGRDLKVVCPTGQYDPTKLVNWGGQPLGLQAGIGYSERWGKLGVRCVMGGVFFTTNRDYFSATLSFPATTRAIAKPRRCPRGQPELHVKPGFGLARRQFLVRWAYNFERRASPRNSFRRAPYRRHSLDSREQAPVDEIQLQQWRPRPNGGDFQNVLWVGSISWLGKPN